ncbi:alpha/beta-hydrolase [Setomelanomma holmii]|uniref:Alpha/beta-hydrolase n=1 Tax=Setomelanomma holmii TaxID=210430 RepID=A0A9P4HGH1_9PLEO|nr:alpha/beta-hydrolase [Setomelanomma holmii]
MHYALPSLALLSIIPSALAAPAPIALLGGLLGGVNSIVSGLLGKINSAVAAKNPAAINTALVKISPVSRPTEIADAVVRASKVWASPTGRTDIYPAIASQVAAGLGPLDGTLNAALTGALPVGENNINNNNPAPPTKIYPSKAAGDATYSLSESALRKAIYIPSGFTYGQKRPVIMVPGTGSYGGINFANNLRKLLTGQSFADPVWLNIPGAMLADAQTNAEYIAYAINYISSVSKTNKNAQNIAVISWSQGGLDTQWVLKYWPSTQKVAKDFLPVSPDFKGTTLANALCLSSDSNLGLNPCPPSVIQQEATSDYVGRLRDNGGDSAYVPTTTFYSGFFDEIVEPQQGTIASAYLNDARGVGVSNNEVQTVCAGQLGGSFYGHAGVLFNPLTYALIVDALKNDGPGSLSRIDVKSVCSTYAAPGLDLDDVIATSALIPIAAVLLLAYPDKRLTEPALRAYAA